MTNYLKKCKLSDLTKTEPEMEKWINQKTSPALAPAAHGAAENPEA